MQRVDRYPGSFQAAGQFLRKQDSREFRVAIRPVTKAPFALKVVELDLAGGMSPRRHVDDPGRGAGLDLIEEQIGQQEGSEMIESEGNFDAIDAKLTLHVDRTRVVEQDVKVPVFAIELLCQASNFLLRR